MCWPVSNSVSLVIVKFEFRVQTNKIECVSNSTKLRHFLWLSTSKSLRLNLLYFIWNWFLQTRLEVNKPRQHLWDSPNPYRSILCKTRISLDFRNSIFPTLPKLEMLNYQPYKNHMDAVHNNKCMNEYKQNPSKKRVIINMDQTAVPRCMQKRALNTWIKSISQQGTNPLVAIVRFYESLWEKVGGERFLQRRIRSYANILQVFNCRTSNHPKWDGHTKANLFQ